MKTTLVLIIALCLPALAVAGDKPTPTPSLTDAQKVEFLQAVIAHKDKTIQALQVELKAAQQEIQDARQQQDVMLFSAAAKAYANAGVKQEDWNLDAMANFTKVEKPPVPAIQPPTPTAK